MVRAPAEIDKTSVEFGAKDKRLVVLREIDVDLVDPAEPPRSAPGDRSRWRGDRGRSHGELREAWGTPQSSVATSFAARAKSTPASVSALAVSSRSIRACDAPRRCASAYEISGWNITIE